MTGWLEDWGEDVPPTDLSEMDDMSSMEGMMSPEEMAILEAADGEQASQLFLQQMTVHHNGAIDMAQTEVDDGQYPDAVDLAEQIIETQQAEISAIRQLLADL